MSGNNTNWPEMVPKKSIVTGLQGWSLEKYGHLVVPESDWPSTKLNLKRKKQ